MKNGDGDKDADDVHHPSSKIVANLKWGKTIYDSKINIQPGSLGHDLKLQIESITEVPTSRQKLLCPNYWRGVLKDTDHLNGENQIKRKNLNKNGKITITLIGSKEKLVEKAIQDRPRFVEDMNPEELRMVQRSLQNNNGDEDEKRLGSDITHCVNDIVALQRERGLNRFQDENKIGMYRYNRLVTGLTQHQIQDKLTTRQKLISDATLDKNNNHDENNSDSNQNDNNTSSSSSSLPNLLGEAVMTMGMELRKAYANSLTVLNDGTLVSGYDDGHIQLWRRGEMVKDIRHMAGGVDHVITLPSSSSNDNDMHSNNNGIMTNSTSTFASAGNGNISIWTEGGDLLTSFNLMPGTTTASLTTGNVGNMIFLASCTRVTRQVDANQFRLVPQDEAGRRRREEAEEQERLIQESLAMATQCVNVWFYNTDTSTSNTTRIGSTYNAISNDSITLSGEDAASITQLASLNGKLVCGDEWGGLRVFEWDMRSSSSTATATTTEHTTHNVTAPRSFSRHQTTFLQFQCPSQPFHFGISCMEPIPQEDSSNNMLAVSIYAVSNSSVDEVLRSTALPLHVPPNSSRLGVCIVDVDNAAIKAVLDAHSDIVQCICPLPDGGILTAGGKMDATVQVWKASSITKAIESDKGEESENNNTPVIVSESDKLKEPGYVFDLKVLPDSEPGSSLYAIAAARYNVVKIVI